MVSVTAEPGISVEELVTTHQRAIWRYLRYLGAGDLEAEEIAQETFVEAWRHPFREYNERATASYLRTVAKNRFLMMLRARSRRAEVSNLEQAEAEFVEFAGDDGGDARIDALRQCLESLQKRARQAVDLVYRDGLSREAAAGQLQLQLEGFKTLLRRARDQLRECVQRRLP